MNRISLIEPPRIFQPIGSASVVVLGSYISPQDHAVRFALNNAIGAIGNTLTLHEIPIDQRAGSFRGSGGSLPIR